jgi:hypothetical protein
VVLVAPPEPAGALVTLSGGEALKAGDEEAGTFSWTVAGWSSRVREKKLVSEEFTIAGRKWCAAARRRRGAAAGAPAGAREG